MFLIIAGLTAVNDRIRKINDRVEEINELQRQREEDSELNNIDLTSMSQKIERKSDEVKTDNIDIANIFSKFNV